MPWEFSRLTFDEFYKLVEGYRWRSEQRDISAARFVAPVINTCTPNKLKKPVTVEMLIGYDPVKKYRDEMNQKKSGQELKAELAGLLEELDGGR